MRQMSHEAPILLREWVEVTNGEGRKGKGRSSQICHATNQFAWRGFFEGVCKKNQVSLTPLWLNKEYSLNSQSPLPFLLIIDL